MKKESKNIKKNKIVDQFEFDEFQKWKIEKEKERIKTHVPTIYGYARVSTEEQHLEPQIKQLKNSGENACTKHHLASYYCNILNV